MILTIGHGFNNRYKYTGQQSVIYYNIYKTTLTHRQ